MKLFMYWLELKIIKITLEFLANVKSINVLQYSLYILK